MKLRIDINDIDSSRIRKLKLNTKRVPVNKKEMEFYDNNLFKVKHIDNDKLFERSCNTLGHYVITVAADFKTQNIAVAQLNSLEDKQGMATKEKRVKNGLIKPIQSNHILGNSRKTGVSIDVYSKNIKRNRKLTADDLEEPYHEIVVSNEIQKEIADFIFNNQTHINKSKSNNEKVKNMRKIK